MSTINGKVCVVDGVSVDKVFSNGRQVYGRNLVLMTNKPSVYPGLGSYSISSPKTSSINVSGEVTVTTDVKVAELFYRFISPSASNLARLTAGETYRFTGKVKGTLSQSQYLNTRNQYKNANDNAWRELPNTRIDVSTEYTTFSAVITVPADAAAFYFSLSVAGSGSINAGDTFTFKDIMYTKDYGYDVPYSPAPEDVLKGDITAPNNLVESQINATTKKLDWK